MKLRNVEIKDEKLLYEWANDSEVRSMAFSSESIEWKKHRDWFEKKIHDEKAKIYIAVQDDNELLGQIRFEIINGSDAEVDVHVKSGFRNKGFGAEIISMGVARFLNDSVANSIHAIIKPINFKSKRAFLKAGFKEVGKKLMNGQECFHLVLNRK